ncbi:MAG: hypothetical protein SFY69_11700 [Planctomycetota bacterium]|nr:hypothetical protein [Planctomycetota bacterium]
MNRLCAAVVVCAGAGVAVAGPDWIENGDAGEALETAQAILGIGVPRAIVGSLDTSLGGPDQVDMYLIRIETPMSFSFRAGNAPFDSQVFLFNITLGKEAFGLLGNNDLMSDSFEAGIAMPVANDGTGAAVLNPGEYALCITTFDVRPVGLNGEIFDFKSRTELSGPDGPGGLNPLSGWIGSGVGGTYQIDLDGVGYIDVPAPAGAALLGLGLLRSARRRR